jgi:hypothetical protein
VSLVALAALAAFAGQGLFGISTVETDTLAWLLGGAALAAAAGTGAVRPRVALHVAGAALAVLVAAGSAYYLVADVAYRSGLERFEKADFTSALLRFERATAVDPLVDVYRVAAADAASYLRGQAAADTLASLDEGLALEPASYDLALARARLMGSTGATPARIADAYATAVDLYPLGLEVRHEAMLAYLEAGRGAEALALAEGVLQTVPDDQFALQVRDLADE